MEEYTPKIHEDGKYVEMLIKAEKCPICHKVMIQRDKMGIMYGLFPVYHKLSQDEQMKRANLVYRSSTKVDDEYICEECLNAGRAYFECSLCKQKRPTDLLQQSFGEPADYLCKVCYETVPAKVWDEKTEELYESHKYDFD